MLTQLTSVIVDHDAENRQEMGLFLANHGVNVVGQYSNIDPLPALLARPDGPQLVVVNLDPNPQESLKRVGALVHQFGHVSFFVLSQVVDPQLLMDAIHLGVREFVPLPINVEKFAAGIERVANMHGMGKRARIIHLIPTIGGCGSTTVACNVATQLARTAKTVLVDLDLVRGMVANSFDIRPRFTIADVIASSESIDNQLLDNALSLHEGSGLAILARPEQPEDTQRITGPGMSRLLSILGRMYDYIVIDSLMSIDPLYATAIQAADINLLVMQLNVPSSKNTERFLGALRRMGIESAKTRIIVNRYVRKGWDIAPEDVERSLGLQISWLVPNDYKNALAATNYGEPVILRAPRCEMSTSLTGLADSLTSRPAVPVAA